MNRKRNNLKNDTVMAFGTFDIIHPGHLYYLQQAKKYGKKLIVVIARDQTVKKMKGALPFFSERERCAMIAALRIVYKAVLGDKIHHCKIIDTFRPDSICLGYDQDISNQYLGEQLKRMNIPIRMIVRAKPYQKGRFKSSLIKKAFHG